MARELKRSPVKRWGKTSEDEQSLPLKNGLPCLRGYFVELKEIETQYGKGHLLVIDVPTLKGEPDDRQTWGAPSVLRMRLEQVTKGGQLIEIYSTGKLIKMRGGEAFDFRVFMLENENDKVEFDPDDDIEV